MYWLRAAVDRGFINDEFLNRLDPSLEPLRAISSVNGRCSGPLGAVRRLISNG
jgi:hypothetical protein